MPAAWTRELGYMSWSLEVRTQVLTACRSGRPYPEIAERFGVPRGTIGYWVLMDRRRRGEAAPTRPSYCPRCDGLPLNRKPYAYLLGLYLGDGHIVSKPKQHNISLYCCDAYPELMDAAEQALRDVMPHYTVTRVQRVGCTAVKSYTQHWVCLFPQHGPGMKHTRKIALTDWQQEIVDEHPWELIRGLIHSDGCRLTNWAAVTRGGERRRYEYPRYFFTNKSDDIRQIYCKALDRVGVEWKMTRRGRDPFNISVARRASVTLIDAHIGAKY